MKSKTRIQPLKIFRSMPNHISMVTPLSIAKLCYSQPLQQHLWWCNMRAMFGEVLRQIVHLRKMGWGGSCVQFLFPYPLVNKHSYRKWPFIVDFPIENGDFP